MPLMSQPSFGPRVALTYVTVGALLDVWTGVWYYAYHDSASHASHSASFWLMGLFFTGLALMVIGLLLGPIGRAARKAELPPAEVTNAEERIQQTAASRTPPVAVTPAGASAVPAGATPVVTPPAART